MEGHKFLRHDKKRPLRSVKGKIKVGAGGIFACECGASFFGQTVQAIKAHNDHLRQVIKDQEMETRVDEEMTKAGLV